MIAAVKVRGNVDAPQPVIDTLENLGLEKKNQIGIYEDTESIRGMLNKAKDFITYGEVDEETLEELQERYGEIEPGTVIDARPPSKGFKDTRKNVNQGGSLGERNSIDDLLLRQA